MDTEAQHLERDRSSQPVDSEGTSDVHGQEGRSRFALVSRAADRLPGGRITLTVLVCLLFLLALGTFVAQPFDIPSSSMERGLRVGDRVLVNKLAYRFGSMPQRGDVVVFDGTGYFGNADYVKRVVGVGGDHVVCCDKKGRLEVNGRSVDESSFLYPGNSPSDVPFDVVVPAGTLFVLGDHRSDSRDSRDHLGSPGGGMIPVGAVIGRADWVIWPSAHWSHLTRPGAYARMSAAEGARRYREVMGAPPCSSEVESGGSAEARRADHGRALGTGCSAPEANGPIATGGAHG